MLLALAMTGLFLSKFHSGWNLIYTAFYTSVNSNDNILRIMQLFHAKGGLRFEQQINAIGSLPADMWV